ncbi:Cysteine-rich repeat secretory protein 55 [Spatholobus suberectus]|nr:Cysteine-rich repeat secretory protein 55 [Spatholobus suberectus]
MSGLAVVAAPDKSFMFHTAVLNTSQSGKKRYGMAQCTRDISKMDCRKCLDAQLVNFRTVIGNKRIWEIYGSNCFMWYNDYRFYSNGSTLLSAAWRLSLRCLCCFKMVKTLEYLYCSATWKSYLQLPRVSENSKVSGFCAYNIQFCPCSKFTQQPKPLRELVHDTIIYISCTS